MTEKEKYQATNILDETDKKMAVLFVDLLNWIRVLRSPKLRAVLWEMRGRLQNSKGLVILNSPTDLQREILLKKYADWDEEELAFYLIEKFYKKKLKLQDRMKFDVEEEQNIKEQLQVLLNIRHHYQCDLEDWFRVHHSN
jgi:hypothetical protein